MATPTPHADNQYVFEGELCEFQVNDKVPKRRWTVVNVPYKVARKFLKAMPYDPINNKGEQRQRIDSHVRKLQRAVENGEYTPAPWAASVRQSHLKNLTIDEKRRKVSVQVSVQNPLALIDGGHRNNSLADLMKAHKDDKEYLARIDALTISVTIYLSGDPKATREDFTRLQEGRAVSKSQIQVMKQMDGNVPEKKKPYVAIYSIVARRLNADDESYFKDEIKFVSGDNGRLEYSAITTLEGSDIATTLGGGAKIVQYPGFADFFPNGDKDKQDFLVACYNGVYQGINEYDEKENFEDPHTGVKMRYPQLLGPGRMLRPTKKGGTKGGTGLLTMLGNMLAFKKLAVDRKTDIKPADLKKVVEVARLVLDQGTEGGMSGPDKRALAGEFAREYFRDHAKRSEADEANLKKLDSYDGVPALLCAILNKSAVGVSADATEYAGPEEEDAKAAGKVPRPDPRDTDPVFLADADAAEAEMEAGETMTIDEEMVDGGVTPSPGPKGKTKVSKKNEALMGTMG